MRVTLRRVLKLLAFALVSALLIAFNMATAPFETVLHVPLTPLDPHARNLLLPTLSSHDGLSLGGWWRPHAAWSMASNATHTTLSNKCQLDAIHNVYQTVALPTAHFEFVLLHPDSHHRLKHSVCRLNSIVTLRAKVDVTAQFKIHPDQVIGLLSVTL